MTKKEQRQMEKERDRAQSALRIIHTWVCHSIENPEYHLDLKSIVQMCKNGLGDAK